MSGTVNISRGIWNDAAFKAEPFTEREAFMWLIMEASYKPRERRVGSISVFTERGQVATSIRFMAEAWSWSKSRVERYLNRLKKRDMIGTASGTGVNVITICKYDEYQNEIKKSGTVENKKRDSSGTAAGQQRDKPNKEVIREKERDTNVSLARDARGIGFEDFWAECQHKIGKEAARKAWAKLSAADRQAASSGLKAFYAWFAKTYPTASPLHPATYLNGKRWQDEGTARAAPVQRNDVLAAKAEWIKSGKPYLCTQITDAQARELVAAGLVTPEQCKAVGVRT